RAERALLDVDSVGVRWLRGAPWMGPLPAGRIAVCPGPDGQANAGDAALRPLAARLLAPQAFWFWQSSPANALDGLLLLPRLTRPARRGATAPTAPGGGCLCPDCACADASYRIDGRGPLAGSSRQQLGRLRQLHPHDVLAVRSRLVLPPGTGGIGFLACDWGGPAPGGGLVLGTGERPTAALSAGGLALVSGDPGARHRPRSTRQPGTGRPLYLPPAHRPV